MRSVSIGPGATAFIRTPYSASSSATLRVRPWMPALAAAVGRVADVVRGPRRALARAGRQVDDAARAPLAHVRRRLARAQEGRAQVELDDVVPVLELGFPDVAGGAAAHVVDQDVEPAVRGEHLLEQRLDRRLLGDVGGDRHRRLVRAAGAARLDQPLGLGEAGRIDVDQHQGRAFLGEAQRDGAAQAIGGAGHEGDLAGHPVAW